jgi:cytoplasmic iron level regulating protein YaaA (DUF328/UPF0246 family)
MIIFLKKKYKSLTIYNLGKFMQGKSRDKTLGLISCSKAKQDYRCKASEMYSASDLFNKAYAYAKKNYSAVAILSARYGLLLPDEIIEPYNETLNKKNAQEVKFWSDRVFEQMKSKIDLQEIEVAYFHAGKKYREHLIPKLENAGIKCEAPIKNLRIGKQKAWYKKHYR